MLDYSKLSADQMRALLEQKDAAIANLTDNPRSAKAIASLTTWTAPDGGVIDMIEITGNFRPIRMSITKVQKILALREQIEALIVKDAKETHEAITLDNEERLEYEQWKASRNKQAVPEESTPTPEESNGNGHPVRIAYRLVSNQGKRVVESFPSESAAHKKIVAGGGELIKADGTVWHYVAPKKSFSGSTQFKKLVKYGGVEVVKE